MSAVALVMSVMLVVAAAAATLGGFDWFIKKFNPPLVKLLSLSRHIGRSGNSHGGYRSTKYDNMAVIYLSLQDVSGQNRLTEQTDFQDGFSVK